jgi:putative membrane fusion protein
MRNRRPFTVIPGKIKKKRSKDKFFYGVLLLVVGILVLQAAYSLGRGVLASMLVKTVISEDHVFEQNVSISGVIVRDEHAVVAPITGTVRWVVAAGDRLALGASVAVITPENGSSRNVSTPFSGVIIPELDGLEGNLHPNALHEIDMKEIGQMPQKTNRVMDGEEVWQGTMLFKVVNNYNWYFVTELTEEAYEALSERKTTTLRFSFAPEDEVGASWSVLSEEENRVRVAFEIKEDLEGYFTHRLADADLIVRRTRGLVLPTSALVMRGEETGVYVLNKSVVRYRPVNVLETDGKMVVVEGVPAGFTVITNPFLMKEGQRL